MRYLTHVKEFGRNWHKEFVETGMKGNKYRAGHIIKNLLLLGTVALLLLLGCPFYNIFKIPCPCCGVTRAWLAFFQGNIGLAFQYHALFPIIPMILLLYLVQEKVPLAWRRYANYLYVVSSVLIFIYAIVRWLGVVVMP